MLLNVRVSVSVFICVMISFILFYIICHNIKSILLSLSLLSLNLLDVLLVLIVYCDVIVNTQTSLTLCLHSPQDVSWCLLWSLLMVSNRGFFICYQYKKNWFGTIFKPIYTCWSYNLLCT